MPPWPRRVYRTVVLDERAKREVDRERERAERFSEQWDGIVWKLARAPEAGQRRQLELPREDLVYVYPANDAAGTPSVGVLYSFDGNEVTVHSILALPAADGDD